MSLQRHEFGHDYLDVLKGTPDMPIWNMSATTALDHLDKAIKLKSCVDLLLVDWRTDYGIEQAQRFLMGLGKVATIQHPHDEPIRAHETQKGKVFRDFVRATICTTDPNMPVYVFERQIILPQKDMLHDELSQEETHASSLYRADTFMPKEITRELPTVTNLTI